MFQLNKILNRVKLKEIRLRKIKLNKTDRLFAALLIVIAALVLISKNTAMSDGFTVKKSIKYLNENILQAGATAESKSFSRESGVIRINLKIGGNDYTSYVTKDGKLFFPEALNLNKDLETTKTNKAANQNQNNQSQNNQAPAQQPVQQGCGT